MESQKYEPHHLTEIRKQTLLASGVQIEGLQQPSGSGPPAVKKVVYRKRKKKGLVVEDVYLLPNLLNQSRRVSFTFHC